MSSYKNVNTDYTLTCNDGNGIFTINAQTVFNGNVIYTVPATTDFAFLTVAANNTGAITDGGLLMKTNANSYAGFRYDTIVNAWQTSPNVYANGYPITAYANLAGIPGGANTQIQFNNNDTFGASANLTFDTANSRLRLTGTQVFDNINSPPANVANAVVVYSNTVGAGGTGLYAQSAAAGGADELVANYKAIVYGIIF
jgi:hypothetical protein